MLSGPVLLGEASVPQILLLLSLINYRTIAKVNGFYLLKKKKEKKKTSFRACVLYDRFYKVRLITSDANDPYFVRFPFILAW